jgi:hypothetical protein
MKKHYLLIAMFFILNIVKAQLTVTTNPTSAVANICASNSISITASAVPVSYTVSTITTSLLPDQGINLLADAGVAITAQSSGINLDNCRWDNISLPFSFTFYGNIYNSVNVSSNGWVGMGGSNSVTTGLGFLLPNAAAPNDVIHGITADLDMRTAAGGTLEYYTDGVAPNRTFVVSYFNVPFLATKGGGTATFQIMLKETSNIVEIHTESCTNTSATNPKAQGVENSTGTATTPAGRNNTASWAATGFANSYRFTPDNINFTWSPATGLNTTTGATVIASPAITTTYTINAVNPNNGATGSTTVTVTVNPSSYIPAAVAGGPQICQNISVSPSGTNFRDISNCNIIATINPAGASPVSNSINTCVKIDTGANKRGTANLYLARKYDIEPILNPATSSANITLYYLQTEFNNYNIKAADSSKKLLPTGPADATGISNLILRQFHGTGTNPGNYTGSSQDFTTASAGFTVVWNSTRNWWEVTVPVTSFSGFYITSAPITPLPIALEYFKGSQVNNQHLLSWKANCTSTQASFEVQRSADGIHFTTIATVTADQARCNQPFDNTDEHPLSGINYYRIKVTDNNDKFYYSNTISFMLKTNGFELLNISPNPVANENAVLRINSGKKVMVTIRITDFTGRFISAQSVQLLPGINQVTLNTQTLSTGAYQITSYTPGETPQTVRLIKH